MLWSSLCYFRDNTLITKESIKKNPIFDRVFIIWLIIVIEQHIITGIGIEFG